MRSLFLWMAMAILSVSAAFAQSPGRGAPPPCDGTILLIRVSEIPSTGSLDKFMAAVAAQKAWYSSHGLPDKIFASKVLVRDAATNTFTPSATQAISYHYFGSRSAAQPPHDAAWDAFVKMFADTSTIKESLMTCISTSMVPSAN